LLKNLVATKTKLKHLYLLNVKGAEEKIYAKQFEHSVYRMEAFNQLSITKAKSIILVEDIINMSKNDERLLRTALNYDAHHKKQKIFCVSHSIHKNSMWSLLPFFHFIIFTSSPSNVPVIRFTFNYFKIEKPQLDSWLKEYLELGQNGRKGIYFFFDCIKMTFNIAENTNFSKTALVGRQADLTHSPSVLTRPDKVDNVQHKQLILAKFESLVDSLDYKGQAITVFSILLNCLNSRLIREHDLSFAFQSKKQKKEIRFSLVDYVTTLLSESAPVSPPLQAFHAYAKRFCHIPAVFCRNTILCSTNV
jgi:hypothetical protein